MVAGIRPLLILLVLAGPLHADDLPPGAAMRLGDSRFRAGGEVNELHFSPDGTELTSRVTIAGNRSRCTQWSVKTGHALASSPGEP